MLLEKLMKKSLLELYALAVCFACTLWAISTLGEAGYAVVRVSSPDTTLGSWYSVKAKSEWTWLEEWPKNKPFPTSEKIQQLKEEAARVGLEEEKRNGVQSLVRAGILFGFQLLLFAVHWWLASRARREHAT